MKICAIIPCYNHADTLPAVLSGLPADIHAIVIDDGSTPKIDVAGANILRLEKNSGKAEALKAGFRKARELGYTHALTLDADGQHDPKCAAAFIEKAHENPDAVIVGVRDFSHPMIPPKRRFMNNFSNFWFRYETKMDLSDTQCGYRLYPLELMGRLKLNCSRYAYELEILVKSAWAGRKIIPIEIPTIYTEESTKKSHYKPFKDTFLISILNTRFSFMALCFPTWLLKKISIKQNA